MFQKIKSKVTDRIDLPGVAHITQAVASVVDAVTDRATEVQTQVGQRLTHPKDAYDRAVTETFGEFEYCLAVADAPVELTPEMVRKLRDRMHQKNPF